jgi:hypothetical protein
MEPRARKVKRAPSVLLAEFDSAHDVLHAAEKVRDAGYVQWDAHTPFPVHGMDRAMGLGDSRMGWIVIVCAVTGLSGAILFELTVLLSAFGAVFGMLAINGLPRHHHPVFESDRFRQATDDKFFISIEAGDPKFDVDRTRTLLESTHAAHVEIIEEDVS